MTVERSYVLSSAVFLDQGVCKPLSDLAAPDHHCAAEAHPYEHSVRVGHRPAGDTKVFDPKAGGSDQRPEFGDQVEISHVVGDEEIGAGLEQVGQKPANDALEKSASQTTRVPRQVSGPAWLR